jgi:tetratricopeptide (TPR) repeat protein
VEDLDRAITVTRQALDAISQDHPDRPLVLSVLAGALSTRFNRTGNLEDLDQAIEHDQEAINGTPQDHPHRAGIAFNLGLALQRRFERTGTLADLDRAVRVFREASTLVSASVDLRAKAARGWGRSAVLAEQWTEAVEGFSTAVELVGLVAMRRFGRRAELHVLPVMVTHRPGDDP